MFHGMLDALPHPPDESGLRPIGAELLAFKNSPYC